MAIELLSSTGVQNAKPKEKAYLLNDGDRLNLRVEPNGSKTWLFIYNLRGVQKKYTIGKYPAISLSRARELANQCRTNVAEGIHPIEAKRAEEAERKANELAAKFGEDPQNVDELFSKWKDGYLLSKHSDRGQYVERLYMKYAAPLIGGLRLSDLRTRHVVKVLDDARTSGVTRTCGVLLSNLRQMFVFGMHREWLQGDPSAGLKSADWNGDAVEDERHFDEDELHEFARVLQESTLPAQWKFAIKLMLATGSRPGETLNAPMHNFNLEKAIWTIPPELQKTTNRKTLPKPHLVELSPFAVMQVEGLLNLYREKAEKRKTKFETPSYLFPAGRGKNGHADEKTLAKAVYARQLDKPLKGKTPDFDDLKMPGGQWSPQDLRRTTATLMGELGIPSDVIDKCQNHLEPNKIKRTYQRQKLRPEMKLAWLKVGQKLADVFKENINSSPTQEVEEEEDI